MRKPPRPISGASRRPQPPAARPKPRQDRAAEGRNREATQQQARGESAPERPRRESASQIKTIPAAISTARAGRDAPDASSQALERSAQRFAERARLRRRLLMRKYAIFGVVLLGILVGVWSVMFSNIFDLKPSEVQIVGASEFVSEDAVRGVIKPHAGTPLARLDLDEIGAEIAQVRGVSSAIVRREWPNGLRVSLAERTPVAAVKSGEEFVLLDADGVRVGVSEQEPDDLAIAQVPLQKGRESSLAAVLTVLDEIPEELRGEIVDIGADTRDTVYFTLEEGERVEWGSSDDSALKATVLEVLRGQEAKIYDVSAPSLPVTRDK